MRRSSIPPTSGGRSYSCGGSAGLETGFPHDGPADHSGENGRFPSLSGRLATGCDRPWKSPGFVPNFSRKVRHLPRSTEKLQNTHLNMKGASFGNLETGAGRADIPFIAASTLRLRIE